MASDGPRFPGTTANLSNAGTSESAEAWVNPGNIVSDNATEAQITAATYDSPDISQILVASNFSFAIPADAVIDGIIVEIDRRSIIASSGKDFRVQLAKGTTFAALVGSNKAVPATIWPTTSTIASYGTGTTDKWGTTWTPAEINAASFAVFLSCQANIANADVGVDFIRVTVHYTAPTPQSAGDSGAGTEAVAVSAVVPAADAGAGAEATGVIAIIGVIDNGVGADAAASALPIGATDAGAGVDAAAIGAVAIAAGDTGAGTHTTSLAAVTVAIGDAGAGSEAAAAAVQVAIAASDAGAGADAIAVRGTIVAADTGTGSETASAALPATLVATTDAGSGTESVGVLTGMAIVAADGGAGEELVVVLELGAAIAYPLTATVERRGGMTGSVVRSSADATTECAPRATAETKEAP